MLTTRIYYAFKPFVPRPLRLAIRRWSSDRLRAQSASEWPILESAGAPPENWRGWPDGKRFAFTLTHDVEGSSGAFESRLLLATRHPVEGDHEWVDEWRSERMYERTRGPVALSRTARGWRIPSRATL